MIKNKKKFSIGQLILNILLIAFLIICIFPLLWMISSSLKGSEELFSEKIYLIPKQFTFEHYQEVFSSYDIGSWFKNSIGTTFGISVLQILVSFLAAFALGYFNTKLNSAVFYFLLIRPENKKKKALSEMRDSLSVGDEVTTIGGIVGKVVHIKDDLVTIETSEDRVRIQFTRWAISTTGTQTTESK